MTLTEILQQQGLTEEQIAAITKAMKDGKIYTTVHENMDVRYPKLKGDFDSLTTEHGESVKLIEQLQKDNKGNAALQQSVTEYQTQIAALQAQRDRDRLDYALKLALMAEDAEDTDYLAYKALEKHPEWKEHPENALDESGKIKGVDDLLAGLKVQHPAQFKQPDADGKKVDPQPLPGGDKREPAPTSLADALRMQYETPNP